MNLQRRRGKQMDSSRVRNLRALLAALAVVTCVARVEAYPSYDNGSGVGCVSCHPGFTGGPSTGVLHQLHTQTFGIGSNCTLCHQTTPGEKPVLTYWSSGAGLATGFGCSGCHGSLYGETIPTGFVHAGDPKSTSYGLRAKHALEGVAVCGTCHFPGAPVHGRARSGTGDPPGDLPPAVLPNPDEQPLQPLRHDAGELRRHDRPGQRRQRRCRLLWLRAR